MYQKVTTDLNFVEREKNIEKFWKDNDIFKKSMEQKKEEKPIPSMTALLLQTANRISDTYLPVLSKI